VRWFSNVTAGPVGVFQEAPISGRRGALVGQRGDGPAGNIAIGYSARARQSSATSLCGAGDDPFNTLSQGEAAAPGTGSQTGTSTVGVNSSRLTRSTIAFWYRTILRRPAAGGERACRSFKFRVRRRSDADPANAYRDFNAYAHRATSTFVPAARAT
jgi:hypothetical protein